MLITESEVVVAPRKDLEIDVVKAPCASCDWLLVVFEADALILGPAWGCPSLT